MTDSDLSPIAPLVSVVDRLLGEGGCPWDREQTLESLRPYVVEEAFEVVDAIDGANDDTGAEAVREELGDLLFLVVFLARLSTIRFGFGLGAIAAGIAEKMIRRHPHVFDPAHFRAANDSDGAIGAWEARKAEERAARGRLSGVPVALPALIRAFRVGEKAAAVGYDFRDATAARAKIDEELGELDEAVSAGERPAIEHELGDALFAVANLGRKLGVDPEAALRLALDRFSSRFHSCEEQAKELGKSLGSMDDAERDRLWVRAKARE